MKDRLSEFSYHADSVIDAWLTLEVLTPQSIPNASELAAKKRRLFSLQEDSEPWNDPRYKKQGKEKAVFWMVYLGELDLHTMVQSILKLFPDERAEKPVDIKGTTTLAVIVLDEQGHLVQGKTFLSSFPWAYGKLLKGELRQLSSFVDEEQTIKSEIERRFTLTNEDGCLRSIEAPDLLKGIDWLADRFHLSSKEILHPGVAIRISQGSEYAEIPEPELLNSFFIEDLVRVREALKCGSVGKALSTYMGINTTHARQDIVQDRSLLSETLAPFRTPPIRWPNQGHYPQVLMQQVAINHAVAELKENGLVAVNGPPGTGKTTLLRDIIAKVVFDRAIALSTFEKPESAFQYAATINSGKASFPLYKLNDRLIGHEIVIASSNNKAVENISLEIPALTAIADDLNPSLRYFQSISDVVAAGNKEIEDGITWGLVAAVLGNSANRNAFFDAFWWHKQRGMAFYLKAIDKNDFEAGELEKEGVKIQSIIDLENPPRSEAEAQKRWSDARTDFLNKLKRVRQLQEKAQAYYTAADQNTEIVKRVKEADEALSSAQQRLSLIKEQKNNAEKLYQDSLEIKQAAEEDKASIDQLKPGFFPRLFSTQSFREWRQQFTEKIKEIHQAREQVKKAKKQLEEIRQGSLIAQEYWRSASTEKANADSTLSENLQVIDKGRELMGDNFADTTFWSQENAKIQMASPWTFDELERAREELFIASFALHRAFINASAKYLRYNLRAAIEVIKGRTLSGQQESVRQSLWTSFFLVVPVISSTFASVHRLFGNLGREQLGWLLIDEAGQAVPQAALGILWRSKRTIVIGDPLQIEPVVTLSPLLIQTIFREFNVASEEWAAPQISAQILADRSSWFGTSLHIEDGEVWVGSPLRVHRRCEEPMFSISNSVAYDGLMVYGTIPRPSSIAEILGESRWLDVESDAQGKWSETEGRVSLQLLERLFEAGMKDPDLFFITPFRMVSHKLRELLLNHQALAKYFPSKPSQWIHHRIGTIHTFQGREAEAVVLLLGAPLESSIGARRWAGSPANLLNVAVTRAKRGLYVIGNHKAWRNIGVFKNLSQALPINAMDIHNKPYANNLSSYTPELGISSSEKIRDIIGEL